MICVWTFKTRNQASCEKAVVCLLVMVYAVLPGLAQTSNSTIILRDGVVFDKKRNEVFLSNNEQRLEALSSKTGSLLWDTEYKSKALGLVNGKLVIQSQDPIHAEISIKALDVKRGGKVLMQDSITILANETSGERHEILDVKSNIISSNLYLFLEYKPQLRGAFDRINKKAITHDSSRQTVLLIDNKSAKPLFLQAFQLPKNTRRSLRPDSQFVLPNFTGQQFLSADANHILLSMPIESDTAFLKYQWKIYDKNGKLLGELYDYRSYAPFLVSGNILYYEFGPLIRNTNNLVSEVPLQIVAKDLRNNSVVWSKPIFNNRKIKKTPPEVIKTN